MTIAEKYEKMPIAEVQRLARLGDKDAMYEMVWHTELLPAGDRDNPVERCAWQDCWFEKAADAGHIDAKSRYARSLIQRIMDKDCRQKAIGYFQSLSDDYDAGKLGGEEEIDGIIAKMWLGVMLCEGYHTRCDEIKGAELIQAADALTNGFERFGFSPLSQIGGLYATGLAQPGKEPSIDDLKKAEKYFDAAINRFNPERDDPNNRGYLQLAKDQLAEQKRRILYGDTSVVDKAIHRKKMMEVSDAARQRAEADKAAVAKLRERLKREG